MDLLLIISFGILLGCFLGISWFAGSDAPYVPTKRIRIKKILEEIKLKRNDVFYELGSGDGRVVLEAAKLGAKSIGIEQSLLRVWYSRFFAWKYGLKKATFIHGDIFKMKYSPARVVFIFLLPQGINKLEQKLRSELKAGTIVVTQTFHFSKWKPYKKIFHKQKGVRNTRLGPKKFEGDFWVYKQK